MEEQAVKGKNSFFEHFLPLFIGLSLVACGFLAGQYWQNSSKESSIVVTLAPAAELKEAKGEVKGATTEEPITQNCAFVASKKSQKYHSGTSRVAKQIKPENLRCFADKSAAEQAGLTPGVID